MSGGPVNSVPFTVVDESDQILCSDARDATIILPRLEESKVQVINILF